MFSDEIVKTLLLKLFKKLLFTLNKNFLKNFLVPVLEYILKQMLSFNLHINAFTQVLFIYLCFSEYKTVTFLY